MSILFLVSIIPYMVPSVVAAYRDLEDKSAIFWVNLLLGWTILGWIAALIWAFTGTRRLQPVEAEGDRRGASGELLLQGGDPSSRHRDAVAAPTRSPATPENS